MTIDKCTFADNGGRTDDSSPEGGAIYQENGTITIRNSIFWDNQTGNDANDGDTIYQANGTLNISYTCMDGTALPRVRFLNGTWGEGIITSGSFSPTLKHSIALARIPRNCASCEVELRGTLTPVRKVKPNFVRFGKKVFE